MVVTGVGFVATVATVATRPVLEMSGAPAAKMAL